MSVPDGSVNRFEFFGDSLGYAMGRRVHRYTRTTTAAEVPPEPLALALEPVMPNPTAGAATLAYHLGEAAAVRLTVFDGLGRRVAVVEEGARAPGRHVVAWDGRDGAGRRLAPGVYHVRLDAGGFARSRPYVIAR